MRCTFLVASAALALAACFEKQADASASAHADAKETAARLTGDDKGDAEGNALCALFKPAELAAYIGEPVGKPGNAAMGSGCQWLAKDGEGDVLIQVIPADYHEPHSGSDGFRKLDGPGAEAFVERAYDGWSAGAIIGEESIVAMVAGEKASAETAEALLREAAKRRAGR
jgi:hypothetical protein